MVKLLAKGWNGKPIKIVEDINDHQKLYTDIIYDSYDIFIQKRFTTVNNDKTVANIYIQNRTYHDNGQVAYINDSDGNEAYFDRDGFPIKK